MKRLLIVAVMFASLQASSQAALDIFLEGGIKDANTLLKNYMEPAFTGFGQGLNSGWYNTAKPHRLYGFDLTVTGNFVYVPARDETFIFRNADYNNVRLSDPARNAFPTLLGKHLPAADIPEMIFIDRNDADRDGDTNEELLRSRGPSGLGLDEVLPANVIPVPQIQLGLGIVKNTELKIRLLPKQTYGDPGSEFSMSMFGLGIMHDIKQWIPGIRTLPFDISAFAGFNRMSVSFRIHENAPDQEAKMKVSGFTFQGIVSKEFKVLTVYAGVGFLTSSSDFSLRGTYSTKGGSLTNPIDLDFTSNNAKVNFGGRLRLWVFTLHAEYAFQRYNTLTFGVGINVVR